MQNDSNISEAVDETEVCFLVGDSVTFLESELLTMIKAKVQSAVKAAKREVLRTTVGEALRDIFLDIYEVAEKKVQDASFQCIE